VVSYLESDDRLYAGFLSAVFDNFSDVNTIIHSFINVIIIVLGKNINGNGYLDKLSH